MPELIEGTARLAEESFDHSDGTPASWIHTYAPAERRNRALFPLAIGLVCSNGLWVWQSHVGAVKDNWLAALLFMIPAAMVALVRYLKKAERRFAYGAAPDFKRRFKYARKWFLWF